MNFGRDCLLHTEAYVLRNVDIIRLMSDKVEVCYRILCWNLKNKIVSRNRLPT